jgi:hypothetical protein
MREKRNELFRSWDVLTAKIYEVERECIRVKGMRKQVEMEKERVRKEKEERNREIVERIQKINKE